MERSAIVKLARCPQVGPFFFIVVVLSLLIPFGMKDLEKKDSVTVDREGSPSIKERASYEKLDEFARP